MSKKAMEKKKEMVQKKKTKYRSLRFKIMAPVILVTVSIVLVFGIMTGILCYNSTFDCVKDSMSSTISTGADYLYRELTSLKQLVNEISTNSVLYKSDTPKEEVVDFLDQNSKQYGFNKGYVIDLSGVSAQSDKNFAESEFFAASKAGKGVYFNS